MSFLKLERLGLLDNRDLITLMIQKLINLRSPTNSTNPSNPSNPTNPTNPTNPSFCWGYNFDWQSRNYLVPRFTPNIICTTFAGNALLDAYEKLKENSYLEMAVSAGNFILKGLNITESKEGLCFSYTPSDHGQIHNANLLGAAFLARLYSFTDNEDFYNYALSAAKFSVSKQNPDGSWPYGEGPKQKWIDNFHTGYNLCALRAIGEYTGSSEFELHLRRGFEFYRKHFFRQDGASKYFHNQTYPIDIHSVAQSIITLLTFKDIDENNVSLALSVFEGSMTYMWNEQGYFYYQVLPFWKKKISYMRWSQAWMLLALATLLEHSGHTATGTQNSLHEARA
jgi:hypothetical protein